MAAWQAGQSETRWEPIVFIGDLRCPLLGDLNLSLSLHDNDTSPSPQVCAFVPSQPGQALPDLQFHFQPLSTTGTPAVYLDTFDAFTASVCILRPESRGRLELQADY